MNIKQIAIILLSTASLIINGNGQRPSEEDIFFNYNPTPKKLEGQSKQNFLKQTMLEAYPTYCALCNQINTHPQNYTTAQQEACNALKNITIDNILEEATKKWHYRSTTAVHNAIMQLTSVLPTRAQIITAYKEKCDTRAQIKQLVDEAAKQDKQ